MKQKLRDLRKQVKHGRQDGDAGGTRRRQGDRPKEARFKTLGVRSGGADASGTTTAEIEAEDREIDRLSRLLGYAQEKKDRKRVAAKLNREYSMFEGMGDDMGDFLMDLDDLADMALGRRDVKRKSVFASENDGRNVDDDAPDEYAAMKGHVIDDEDQEESDIEETGDDGGEEEEQDAVEEEEEGEEEEAEDEGDEDDEEEDVDAEEEEVEEDDHKASRRDSAVNSKTYRPTDGEDIYGRRTEQTSLTAAIKYVAPAKRASLQTVDETSDSVKMVRRQMNGLLNRLSDQSKDSILRSVKDIFASNSFTVVSHVLRDCIMAACANPTQLMVTLIPVYASIVVALHFVVGIDVGAFVVESLTNTLFASIEKIKGSEVVLSGTGVGALISDKLPNNCLLLLSYFYNLRILHHRLIVDVMKRLASDVVENTKASAELCAELLVCIVDHCGIQLRSDDPVGLREVVTTLTSKTVSDRAKPGQGQEGTRIQFLLGTLTDLKNNKSKRTQSVNGEVVKRLRKWLGSIKSVFPCKQGDLCLNVTLRDLLDAEKRGRWWRAGASWLGNEEEAAPDDAKAGMDTRHTSLKVDASEEQKLLAIASKMRFNTDVRRKIFVVIMSSRDVSDAFERLGKLDLKGKQDREVVRVIVECCGQEMTYNKFYAELASLLCSQNRQYKTTLQFHFWDAFKDLSEGNYTGRRTMNLAHLLAHMVCAFHLPLSVIKPIDFTQLSDALVLFLATFFLAIFSNKISDEAFVGVFDRVATTKDFSAVRDIVLSFLQTHFLSIPQGLDPELRKGVEKRRLKAIKLMNSMEILSFTQNE